MEKNNEKNKRIALYSEIGQYFSPDGAFNRKRFQMNLMDLYGRIEDEDKEGHSVPEVRSAWLTDYLSGIFDYMREKDMAYHIMDIFNAALEISESYGVSSVAMPTRFLREMINSHDEKRPGREEKKISHDDKRELIFSAAVRVFADKGYHKATMDEIATLAGMGKGSIYRHFKSKEELLKQLLNEKYEDIIKRISQIFEKDRDVLLQIREMIEVWIDFIEKNHVVYRLIQNESLGPVAGENTMFYDYFINHLPMFKERILAMNKENKLKTTGFYTVFYGILGFIDGVVHKWFRRGMDYPLRNEIPVIIEVLFKGFVGEAGTPGHA